MQPYFMPYIGYFNLIHACDALVFLDDDFFKVRGWVNRNKVGSSGSPVWLTIPVKQASQNRRINSLKIVDRKFWLKRTLLTLRHLYHREPFYERFGPVLRDALASHECLDEFLINCVVTILEYVGLERQIYRASQLESTLGFSGQRRVVKICKQLNACRYVNLRGGMAIYRDETFLSEDISLGFVWASEDVLKQTGGLSAIDFCMRKSPETVLGQMAAYQVRTSDGGIVRG